MILNLAELVKSVTLENNPPSCDIWKCDECKKSLK